MCARGGGGVGVLPYIDYMGMCRWPGYGFQAFKFRTGFINQENNVGNMVYNYIKLCRWPGYCFQAFKFRTGFINQENNVGNMVYNYIKPSHYNVT